METKEFKKNEIVENHAQTFDAHEYQKEDEVNLNLNLDLDLVNKAFKKISELWNKNEKTRGFVFMLIKSFCSNVNNIGFEVKNTEKDCILGIDVCSFSENKNLQSKCFHEQIKYAANGRHFTELHLHIMQNILPKYSQAAINGHVAVTSVLCSNKFLSRESHWALLNFIDLNNLYYINRKSFKQKKQEPKTNKNKLTDIISEDTLSKLKSIK